MGHDTDGGKRELDGDLLRLNEAEEILLAELLGKTTERGLMGLIQGLSRERTLEHVIYSSREQWFWVPWTTFIGVACITLSFGHGVALVGVPLILGVLANVLAFHRLPAMKASFECWSDRHKWLVAITDHELVSSPSVRIFGFDNRLTRERVNGSDSPFVNRMKDEPVIVRDPPHALGFKYFKMVMWLTPWIWIALLALGGIQWNYGPSR